MKAVSDRTFYISAVCLMALAACWQLFFFSRGFYSISWDESGRTLDAYKWAVHGTIGSEAWLPFYRILVGSALRAFPDLFLTPRIITFCFGLATIPVAAWLAHELFQNRKTTLLTLALTAFFSQRLALSLAPLSEIMFIFLILLMMSFFARWLRTFNRTALFLTALCGTVACTNRYEGWIFAGAIFLIIATHFLFMPGRRRSDLILFSLILFGFPAGFTALTFFPQTAMQSILSDALQYSRAEILRKNPVVEFFFTNAFTLNLIGLISIFHLVRRGEWRHKAIIVASFTPLAVSSCILLILHSAQTGPSWRMIGVWSMLLVPFTASFLTGNTWLCSAGQARKLSAVGAIVLVLLAFSIDTLRIERNSSWAFPEYDRQAGQYLNKVIVAAPETKILIESSKYFFLNVLVASQYPDAFVENSIPEQRSVPVLSVGDSPKSAVERKRASLLVFRSDKYKNFLNQSRDVSKLRDFGPWSIYKLTQ